MTRQLEAVLIIARHPVMEPILMPLIDLEHEEVRWDRIRSGLSGGERAAAAWAWCVWNDHQIPVTKAADWGASREEGWRDPFEGFGVMSPSLQRACLQALLHRHEYAGGAAVEQLLENLFNPV